MKPKADWLAIEAEYRAGISSVREIARRHSITHVPIVRRAARHGWTRDVPTSVNAPMSVVDGFFTDQAKIRDAAVLAVRAEQAMASLPEIARSIARDLAQKQLAALSLSPSNGGDSRESGR